MRPLQRSYGTAVERWSRIGPYYAMFPVDFAFQVIKDYSQSGDAVLDPFAGRFSSIYAAAAMGRRGLGIEINPVGWLYGSVKANPASMNRVLGRLEEVGRVARTSARVNRAAQLLPTFFKVAYTPKVLCFLIAARRRLAWRTSIVDATLIAFILVYLHGKRERSLSNQMRDGKAMAPAYAVRWWRARNLAPPRIDPVAFLRQRIEWRYKWGTPALRATSRLGDSVRVLQSIRRSVAAGCLPQFDLLFTSPPYFGVTNYHLDQWLRLWLLGGPPDARRLSGPWTRKFSNPKEYVQLLSEVFARSAKVMTRQATVYVRTDARDFTLDATLAALSASFPRRDLTVIEQPLRKHSQTALFGDSSAKPGEVDLILTP